VFFGLVMLLMFWIGAKWREDPGAPATPMAAQPSAPAAVAAPASRPAGHWPMVVALMAVTAVWPLADRRADATLATGPVQIALGAVDGWSAAASGSPLQEPAFEPRFSSPSATIHEHFRRDDADVGLFVAFYRDQRFDRKLVSSENRLVASQDPVWHVVRVGALDVEIGGRESSVPMTELQTYDGRTLVALQWYWVDGIVTSRDAVAKAATAWSRLRGHGDDSASIIVYSRASTTVNAKAELRAFVRDAWPPVEQSLGQARMQP
jgi:EpsI family protein